MNLTQAVRKANLKKWKAQKPARIDSPLRAIHAHYPDLRNEKGEIVAEHATYTEARRAAARGDGSTVKRIAASIQ
jgi:hypothetical protein